MQKVNIENQRTAESIKTRRPCKRFFESLATSASRMNKPFLRKCARLTILYSTDNEERIYRDIHSKLPDSQA